MKNNNNNNNNSNEYISSTHDSTCSDMSKFTEGNWQTMKEQPHVVGFIFGCEDHDFLIFCAEEGFKV